MSEENIATALKLMEPLLLTDGFLGGGAEIFLKEYLERLFNYIKAALQVGCYTETGNPASPHLR